MFNSTLKLFNPLAALFPNMFFIISLLSRNCITLQLYYINPHQKRFRLFNLVELVNNFKFIDWYAQLTMINGSIKLLEILFAS